MTPESIFRRQVTAVQEMADQAPPTYYPPAYETLEDTAFTNEFTKPLTLKLCKPLLNSATGKVSAGKAVEAVTDAIHLSRTLKYRELARTISSKIELRYGGRVKQDPGQFKWTILAVDDERRHTIPFTVENVAAVVDLLRDARWGLEVKFTEVPIGYTTQRWKAYWLRFQEWYRAPSCGICRLEQSLKESRYRC